MTVWTQYTYVNKKLAYEPKRRSADRMLGLFAQMHFLKQGGENITVGAETDENFNVIEYKVTRVLNDKELFYRFVKGEVNE